MPRYNNLFSFENKLSPSGWFLAFILTFYVLAGLIGKDPWKGEDAIHINVAWQILQTGDWQNLTLAGEAFDSPPLYYWSAAMFGKIFSQNLGILSLHDAIRLASGFWLSISLVALYYGAREQFGHHAAAAAPMLLAGCVGLIIHSHDAQPMLIALAAYSTALAAIFVAPRKPYLTTIFLTLALLSSLLGVGILISLPIIILAIIGIFLFHFSNKNANVLSSNLNLNEKTTDIANLSIVAIFFGILFAVLAFGFFLRFDLVNFDSIKLNFNDNLIVNLANLKLLKLVDLSIWFLFPILPLAICGLFHRQQTMNFNSVIGLGNMNNNALFNAYRADIAKILLIVLWISTSFIIIFSAFFDEISHKSDEILFLLLLPELAMLATIGVLNLRRGAVATFDWFSITCFSIFCGFVWVCWSAMRFGFPAKLSQRIYILRPGFVPENFFNTSALILLILAICATIYWIYLLLKLEEKSPYRCLTHWTLGLTIFWFLAACLVIDWFDYGKSYRPIGEGIVQTLNKVAKNEKNSEICLAEIGLTATQRASLSYFTNIVKIQNLTPLVKAKNADSKINETCKFLVLNSQKYKQEAAKFGYNVNDILWEGKRKKEKFYLIKK